MALTAVRIWPLGPELSPADGGLFREIWRYTGDGADADIVLTPNTFPFVYFVDGNGATNDMSTTPGTPSTSVTFTFPAAPGNGLKGDITLYGKKV